MAYLWCALSASFIPKVPCRVTKSSSWTYCISRFSFGPRLRGAAGLPGRTTISSPSCLMSSYPIRNCHSYRLAARRCRRLPIGASSSRASDYSFLGLVEGYDNLLAALSLLPGLLRTLPSVDCVYKLLESSSMSPCERVWHIGESGLLSCLVLLSCRIGVSSTSAWGSGRGVTFWVFVLDY